MELLPFQKELEKDLSRILLLVGGYGSGKTTAVVNKAIHSGNVAIVCATKELSSLLKNDLSVMDDDTSKITVLCVDELNELKQQDLIILEDFDVFPYYEAMDIYTKIASFTPRVLVTCTPMSDFKLEDNFCYLLSNSFYGKKITISAEENPFIPPGFVEELKKQIPSDVYKYYIEGRFIYSSDKED